MYIDPFWAGVLATLFTELGVLFVVALFNIFGGKR